MARINKDLNKQGARYTITPDGRVQLNSNYIIDPMEFSTLSKSDRTNVLKGLPPRQTTPTGTPRVDVSANTFNKTLASVTEFSSSVLINPHLINSIVQDILKNKLDLETISGLLTEFSNNVIQSILNILVQFLGEIQESLQRDYNRLYPLVNIGIGALQFLINHIKNLARTSQIDFEPFLATLFNHDGSVNIYFVQAVRRDFTNWTRARLESLQSSLFIERGYTNVVKQRHQCEICKGYYYASSS